MGTFTTLAIVTAIGVALLEWRRPRPHRRRPWTGYSPAVLYTRGGEPRWGVVGTWERRPAVGRMKRRLRALRRARGR